MKIQKLLAHSVELSHYNILVLEIRKKNLTVIRKSKENLFLSDIERAIRNCL